ncbi:MAG: hypothetical protein K8H88_28620, partial [Sandaracinaceae bacterium]|nr:hypothetical protein [Sandaracinaceae bacterium]
AQPAEIRAHAQLEVQLDGQALELDPNGRGQRRYPVDPTTADAEGLVRHVVRYRIHPPQGEIAQGELRTRVPVTSLQLDRPGREVITDREELEIAGAVAPGATVTVDGQEVAVQMGRFVHRVTLALGERDVEVIARARGKAPRIERIHARRVADLEAEAARFEVDAQLTYPRVAQSPAIYRGQHAAFTGMVYNVLPTRSGRGELQLLVDDCADSTGCALWVTYPASIEVAVRARVRVLGTVAGDQQFRSQSGQVRTVPRLDATFVLPASAPRRR